MPPKKNIGPRVSDKTREWLSENFSSLSAGAELVLECNRVLYTRTLNELKGKFNAGELTAMIDVMNAHFLTPFATGTELDLSLGDSIPDGIEEKYSISVQETITKLKSLPAYSRAVLEWWANGFWYGGGEKRPERDISAYVQNLARKDP